MISGYLLKNYFVSKKNYIHSKRKRKKYFIYERKILINFYLLKNLSKLKKENINIDKYYDL